MPVLPRIKNEDISSVTRVVVYKKGIDNPKLYKQPQKIEAILGVVTSLNFDLGGGVDDNPLTLNDL